MAQALQSVVDGAGGVEALDVIRRAAATANKRGACSHPDGTVKMVLSALEVFTEDLSAHVFHGSCGRPVRGVLPLPEGPQTESDVNLTVDWVRCQGHGLCAHLIPELIHLDSSGFPVITNLAVPGWLGKEARTAVEMCPALALRLAPSEKKGGDKGDGSVQTPIPAPTMRGGLLSGERGRRRAINR
jgi:ferredoxin